MSEEEKEKMSMKGKDALKNHPSIDGEGLRRGKKREGVRRLSRKKEKQSGEKGSVREKKL